MIVVLVALLSAFMFLMAPPPEAPVQFGSACVTTEAEVEMATSRFVVDRDGGLPGGAAPERSKEPTPLSNP
jgi:hypothetical protein